MPPPTTCDALVVGAGPAGAACARVLALAGRRVRVWDERDVPARRIGESLPGAARSILRDLELSALLDCPRHRVAPARRVVWESEQVRMVDGLDDPHGPGLHLDRPRFERDLRTAATDAGAALERRRFTAASREGAVWSVSDSAGGELRASMLIDAAGRRAPVMRSLGIARIRDAPLVSVVEWRRRADADIDECTRLEAVPEGWWYSAPTADGERVFALHVRPQDAARLVRDEDAWRGALNESRLVGELPRGPACAARSALDASGGRSAAHGGVGWLAVGDAALSFDPLSSQGLFHALYTGLRGGQAVDAALSGHPEAGLSYGREMAEVRRRYLAHQTAFMAAVRHFPHSRFWG